MTETQIRAAVTEMRKDFERECEFAEFCRVYAPGYITLSHIFAPVRWDMSLERDREFDAAMLMLQSRGYRV